MFLSLQVLDEPGSDEEDEHESDEHDEERGLADEVVEALALWVQKRDAVRLHDRPDDSGEDGERAEELDSDDPAVPP